MPTQLRAFRAVVRLGSVKEAAAELHVSEAAVSLHIGQLRRELEDQLFTRTGNGLAFTPGGLRLGADADRAGLHLDVAELVVKVVHFDEVLKVREADLHYGQEAVTTRHQAGRVPLSLQRPMACLVDAGGPLLLERRGDLHGVSIQLFVESYSVCPYRQRHTGSP